MASGKQFNIDIDKPRYDQETYSGRAKHFFQVTNPMNLLVTGRTLEDAKTIVTKFRKNEPLPENITEEEIWKAKVLYDSAFHPDTGEKVTLIGRMSAQVPMNIIITGGMMTFYQTTPAVLFWQWINQSFNAVVNYSNRSGDAKFTTTQLLTSYVSATTGAVATAVGLNKLVKNAPPLVGRFVPLAAVAAANCINIPLMRLQCGEPLPMSVTEKDLWKAKVLYDSAYHPDTGEKMTLFGRMSAQVPGNLFFNWGMLTFYKTAPGVIFWQWFNQSFNALVNYTNRSGDLVASNKQIYMSYFLATAGAVGTALGLKRILRNSPPLFKRFVPFAAVAAAHCVNIPIMRSQELKTGTPIHDEDGRKVGYSKHAAQSGISKVVLSRILMQAPSMLLTPVVLDYLERRGTLCRYPWAAVPVTIGFAGFCLLLATPACCAIFRQKAMIAYKDLESDLKTIVDRKYGKHPPKYFFYNKGLEIQNGTPIFDENNNRLGNSKNAAVSGITQVICSRVSMAMPGMVMTPILVDYLDKRGLFKKYPWANLPIQMAFVGAFLTFATPLACAFFKQKASISFDSLEKELKDDLEKKLGANVPKYVYYNKGL